MPERERLANRAAPPDEKRPVRTTVCAATVATIVDGAENESPFTKLQRFDGICYICRARFHCQPEAHGWFDEQDPGVVGVLETSATAMTQTLIGAQRAVGVRDARVAEPAAWREALRNIISLRRGRWRHLTRKRHWSWHWSLSGRFDSFKHVVRLLQGQSDCLLNFEVVLRALPLRSSQGLPRRKTRGIYSPRPQLLLLQRLFDRILQCDVVYAWSPAHSCLQTSPNGFLFVAVDGFEEHGRS
jgi:hypothetical protein